MSKMSVRDYDKSGWGPGPWQEEPDTVEFRHAGLPCILRRHERHGNFCGYVGVPPTHPDHGKNYNDVEVEVHGGLTFGDECSAVACHVPAPGEPDNFFWFGFDCHHSYDLAPGFIAIEKRLGMEPLTLSEPYAYRDLAYVRRQTEQLAEQLAARASA